MGQRSVSVAELRAECTNLERGVLHAGLASETELAPNRPGGEQNDRKDARGYLRYFAVLHRFHARGEHRTTDVGRARADAEVMAALRDEPIRVELLEPIPEAPGSRKRIEHLYVYPKSYDALFHAHALDRKIGQLLIQKGRVEEAGAQGMPRADELLDKVTEVLSYVYGLLVWIVTSEGPAKPYTLAGSEDPELPFYIQQLSPIDVLQICTAAEKHHSRVIAVQSLLETRSKAEGGKRPSWSQFFGSLAIELDEDSVNLSCYRSLNSLLASVQLDADAKRIEPDENQSKAADASSPPAGTLA